MDTAFVIGNGESRSIFPIKDLKGHGVLYGCNGIYRDYPTLCDHIVAVSPEMFEELNQWHQKENPNVKRNVLKDLKKDKSFKYIKDFMTFFG